jgi:nitrate reductase gamma subunit
MLPRGRTVAGHPVLTVASVVLHLAMIITPIFLGAHILLWRRGLGIGWPALPQAWADALTLAGIAAGLALVSHRATARAIRGLSRPQDYGLPVLVTIILATGYLAQHPARSPVDYDAMMLLHVVSGNLLLIFLPFSKLSHAILFPVTRLTSELGWHLVPGAGQRVAVALHKEDTPI